MEADTPGEGTRAVIQAAVIPVVTPVVIPAAPTAQDTAEAMAVPTAVLTVQVTGVLTGALTDLRTAAHMEETMAHTEATAGATVHHMEATDIVDQVIAARTTVVQVTAMDTEDRTITTTIQAANHTLFILSELNMTKNRSISPVAMNIMQLRI